MPALDDPDLLPPRDPEEEPVDREALFDEGDYQPTDKQAAFRVTAIRCCNGVSESTETVPPRLTTPEWIQVHQETRRERVALSEFERWCKDPAFSKWFYAAINWTPSAQDLALADGALHRSLVRGIVKEDPRCMALYAETRGHKKRAREDAPATIQGDIQAWRERAGPGGASATPASRRWRTGTADE